MSIQVAFENPNKKPLGELTFPVKDNGVTLTVPALSKHWVEAQPHAKYFPLPVNKDRLADANTINEWLNEAEWFNREVEWMLGLEHYRFWSYILFEPACINSIVSFLQEATPCYIPILSLTDDPRIATLYSSILKNVLAVICRLITNKESETEWMTKDHLAELLYKKFLISIPMIFDIFIAYGRSNAPIIKRIIETIIKIEPKYENDMLESLQALKSAFQTIASKTDANEINTSAEDLAFFALDCAYTIHTLVEIYPAAHEFCIRSEILQSVTNFYDSTIPKLHRNIHLNDVNSIGLKHLNYCRMELLGFFRTIICKCMDTIIDNPSESLAATEQFITILQEAVSDREFVIDYQNLYPIQNDIEILRQACAELKMFKIDFIVHAFTSDSIGLDERFGKTQEIDNVVEPDVAADDNSGGTASSSHDSDVQLVLDILPHLERTFVVKLLSRYENAETAIAAILEGNLPPDLDVHNATEASDPTPINEPSCEKNANLDDVSKLLDNIGINEGTTVIIKCDKRRPMRAKNERKVLDDKSTIREWKTRYEAYGYVSEDYEDEYDDSYDALADSETKSVNQQLKQSGALNVTLDDVDDSESDSSEEEPNRGERDPRRDFCENPEVVRERLARMRSNRFPNTHKRPTAPIGDVVGKAKGQGQDTSTVISRHKKDVHKSSRGNHNRRQGAAFKRNRGMIPS